jgi:hypothetical protein
MMYGGGKSDPVIVAAKPANKAEASAAEPGEPRCGAGGAKDGNQGECGPTKHMPGTGLGKCVTGVGPHTTSR